MSIKQITGWFSLQNSIKFFISVPFQDAIAISHITITVTIIHMPFIHVIFVLSIDILYTCHFHTFKNLFSFL